jgi:hypothetical protein
VHGKEQQHGRTGKVQQDGGEMHRLIPCLRNTSICVERGTVGRDGIFVNFKVSMDV